MPACINNCILTWSAEQHGYKKSRECPSLLLEYNNVSALALRLGEHTEDPLSILIKKSTQSEIENDPLALSGKPLENIPYQEVVFWQSRDEGRLDGLQEVKALSRPPVAQKSATVTKQPSTRHSRFSLLNAEKQSDWKITV